MIFRFGARQFHRFEDGVAAFEGGEDAFVFRQGVEGGEGVFIEAIGVGDAASIVPVAVFGADAGIVEAGGHRVDVARLAVIILHDVTVTTMKDAGAAVAEWGGVVARFWAATAGFDAARGAVVGLGLPLVLAVGAWVGAAAGFGALVGAGAEVGAAGAGLLQASSRLPRAGTARPASSARRRNARRGSPGFGWGEFCARSVVRISVSPS